MAKPSRPSLTWSSRVLLFLFVLCACLLICLWRCNHSVSAEGLAFVQQLIVEVEVEDNAPQTVIAGEPGGSSGSLRESKTE